MESYLKYVKLWKYTRESEVIFPNKVTQVEINRVEQANVAAQLAAGRNLVELARVLEVELVIDYEDRKERQENKYLKACNAIRITLGTNYYNDLRGYINAAFMWIAVKEACKSRGSDTLNNRYRRLLDLKLSDFKDVSEYARKFKETYNEIRNIYERLKLNDNFLIFLFYTGLGKEYKNYFLYYIQKYIAIDTAGRSTFSLEYITQRFI